jgi:hypothetical protein
LRAASIHASANSTSNTKTPILTPVHHQLCTLVTAVIRPQEQATLTVLPVQALAASRVNGSRLLAMSTSTYTRSLNPRHNLPAAVLLLWS